MVKADVIYLISDEDVSGVFDDVNRLRRMVYCTVRSVGMTETYQAKSYGLEPQYVFDLADYAEYNGEPIVEYNGIWYDVFRTYVNGQKIEITVVERSGRDAG